MKRLPSFSEMVSTTRRELTWRRAVLAIVLLMNLRTFQFFPGGRPVEEGWFVLCFVSFITLYPLFKAQADWRFSKLELYLLGLIVVLAIMPAVTANFVFGQPLIYGVLARRSTVLVTTWLLLIQVWQRRWINARDVEVVLLWLVWFIFILYGSMRLFLDPLAYPDAPFGFVLGVGTENQSFSIPGYLVPFGAIYYALRGIRERRLKPYLLGALLFLVGAGSSWRALSLFTALTLLFFLLRWRPLAEAFVALAKFAAVMSIVILVLQMTKPEVLSDIVDHFVAAVQVTLGGSKGGEDASADARVEEVNIALPYVREHPIFGVGEISGQWAGGPPAVLGGYFAAADIGVIGTIFAYGIVGLVFSACQYLFALRAGLQRPEPRSTLLDGVKGYVLFSALFSITTSFFVVALDTSTFFVVLSVLLTKPMKIAEPAGAYRLETEPAALTHA